MVSFDEYWETMTPEQRAKYGPDRKPLPVPVSLRPVFIFTDKHGNQFEQKWIIKDGKEVWHDSCKIA